MYEEDDVLSRLWAKSSCGERPFHPLWCHLLDIAAVCETLLPRFGGVDGISNDWAVYLVALHDIGKADRYFQNKVKALADNLEEAGIALPPTSDGFRHEARSAEWMRNHLMEVHGWKRNPANVAAGATRGHHGNFDADVVDEGEGTQAVWQPLRDAVAARVADALNIQPGSFQPAKFDDASATGVKLVGMTVLSDWISSSEALFHYPALDPELPAREYLETARVEARRAIARLAFDKEKPAGAACPTFHDVWPGIPSPRACQVAVEEACMDGVAPGLAIIEAPMGEGKTEAALYVAEYWNRAEGRQGAYMALPTQATSNQMHSRYSAFLRARYPNMPEARLVHGMAWLLDEPWNGGGDAPETDAQTWGDEKEPDPSLEWFRNQKRALLAPDGVGTVDQSLMAALNVKHGFLRLLGLSAKTLIIDEVHAYDEYMVTLMERLLQWCRALRIPVILLSATLSARQKQRLADAYAGPNALPPAGPEGEAYPLITFVPLDGPARLQTAPPNAARDKTVHLELHSGLLENPEGTAQLAVAAVADGGCACVLVNTVISAQKVFEALQEMGLKDTDLCLFHARLPAQRRDEIEKDVVARFGKEAGIGENPPRPKRAIIVGTQVLESSIDLDWDVLITEIAPLDLLLQRAGRLWRHEGRERGGHEKPVLHVLLPEAGAFTFGPTEKKIFASTGRKHRTGGGVYHRAPLLRTLALLHNRAAFQLPADFRPLIEGCYGSALIPPGVVPPETLQEAEADWDADLSRAGEEAREHLIPPPSAREFALTRSTTTPVDEHEDGDGRKSYFHAQTRRDDDSLTVLVLEDSKLIKACRRKDAPDMATLRALFLQKAGLPGWWLAKAEPAAGYEAPFQGQKWLRSATVLPMRNNEWRGTVGGTAVTIANDPALGLTYQKNGPEQP